VQGNAGRVVLNFTGNNVLSTVHTQDNVRMVQHQKPASASASAQDVEITASVIDFVLRMAGVCSAPTPPEPPKLPFVRSQAQGSRHW